MYDHKNTTETLEICQKKCKPISKNLLDEELGVFALHDVNQMICDRNKR